MSNNPIIFNLGEETRPVVETNLVDSMFAELYQKAFVEINSYLESVEKQKKNKRKMQILINEEINNIFAFIGERGAGKTSCMLTVANALHLDTNEERNRLKSLDSNNKSNDNSYQSISDTVFEVLDIIDPSFFDTKNNILSLIIAKLFKNFKKKASDTNCNHGEQNRRNLIELFEQVQKDLSVLFSKEDHLQIDSLESLSELSAAVDLKDNIYKLVESYLEFVINDKDASSKLVIMIDDIDLHTQHARDMVEQVRKYFIQSNVVILMSVKIDQLDSVLKNHLTKEYKDLLSEKQMLNRTIDQMSERYIGKLIPHSHRFFLQDISNSFDKYLTLKLDGEEFKLEREEFKLEREEFKLERMYNAEKEDIEHLTLHNYVLGLIKNKTDYVFLNKYSGVSYIVPTNLRELRHFIMLLIGMKNDSKSYNNIIFQKYFIETWCNNNLNKDARIIISSLFAIAEVERINKNVIQSLQTYYNDLFKNLDDTENYKVELKAILNPANINYNISLGDVLAIVDYLSTIIYSDFDKKFLFAIKFFYTIKLKEFIQDDVHLHKNERKELQSKYIKITAGSLVNTVALEERTGTRKNQLAKRVNKRVFDKFIENGDLLSTLLPLFIATTPIDRVDFRESSDYRFKNILIENILKANDVFIDISALLFNVLYLNTIRHLKHVSINNESNIFRNLNPELLFHLSKLESTLTNVELLDEFKEILNETIVMSSEKEDNGVLDIIINFFINMHKSDSVYRYEIRPLRYVKLLTKFRSEEEGSSSEFRALFVADEYVEQKKNEYNELKNELNNLKSLMKNTFVLTQYDLAKTITIYRHSIKNREERLNTCQSQLASIQKTIDKQRKNLSDIFKKMESLKPMAEVSTEVKNNLFIESERLSDMMQVMRKECYVIEKECDEIQEKINMDTQNLRREERMHEKYIQRINQINKSKEDIKNKMSILEKEASFAGFILDDNTQSS